jgi:hypothetical protein
VRRWRWTVVATALGVVAFALSVAHGERLTMLWLPAVMLGASWPRSTWRRCKERL